MGALCRDVGLEELAQDAVAADIGHDGQHFFCGWRGTGSEKESQWLRGGVDL